MKELSLCILLLFLAPFMAEAQDIPPVYSQFYMNPAIYNPAFAGSDGYASLYLAHRRQWVGIEGAPLNSTVSLHAPLSRTTAAGFMLSHEKMGVLQHVTAEGQFAYILPLGQEHHLRMGLAAGLNQFSMDLSEATPEQRAYLANRSAHQRNFQAKFGINYHYKAFNIGISSNSLFRNSLLNGTDNKQLSLSPLQDMVINAIYYIPVIPDKLHLEPYMIYHRFASYQRTEAGMLFYFKNTFWTGASYRSEYGLTGYFGLKLKDTVKFAYAFEAGNSTMGGMQHGSHELLIAIQLGKEKTYNKEVIRKPRFEF